MLNCNASPMKSNSLYDAKQECQNNPSCKRFYNNCGDGIAFYLCEDSSSDIYSQCGSVLYSGGNIIARFSSFLYLGANIYISICVSIKNYTLSIHSL